MSSEGSKGLSTKRYRSRPSQQRNKSNSSSTSSVTRQQIFGGKFSPPANPPDVTYIPWTRLTVVKPFNGSYSITTAEVASSLKSQIDSESKNLSRDCILNIKLHTIQCWNLSGHCVSLSVFDYSDSTKASNHKEALVSIIDTGNTSSPPKAGFKLPLSCAQHVLTNTSEESAIPIAIVQAGTSDQGLVYLTLDFKMQSEVKLPALAISRQPRMIDPAHMNQHQLDSLLQSLKKLCMSNHASDTFELVH